MLLTALPVQRDILYTELFIHTLKHLNVEISSDGDGITYQKETDAFTLSC